MAVRTAPTSSAEPRQRGAAGSRRPGVSAALAVVSLVALPLVVYGVPALFGHVVAPGDDLTQSLPLRQLVGRDIAAGHLPVFDPYLWSGTPLLAGWNAGAAYPLTWLFAVLPAAAAWTVTLASAAVAAGVGCYAFLSANGLGVVASWLGALTFTFGGGMSAQVSHIGLVVGMAWVPFGLLAILRLTEPAVGHRDSERTRLHRARWVGRLGRPAAWVAVLAGSVGLVVLAGEPRAVSDAATILVLYGAWRLARLAAAARRGDGTTGAVVLAVAGVVVGGALGLGLGAVQLLPGLAAVAGSQRAAVTAFLYSAGSLPTPWLLLLGVPDLLGGSGTFGQPTFFASYNLTEVTGYVGMLPLVAVGSMLGRLRFHRPLPEWAIWYVVAVAGVLLTLGAHTPLWHLLIRIPLFGGQRLQSRSILITGLALAVLLAYWADGWVADLSPPARRERLLGTVLPAAVIVVVVVALVWRVPFMKWTGVAAPVASHARSIGPWLVPFLVLAVAAIAIVWAGRRSEWDTARRGVPERRRWIGRRWWSGVPGDRVPLERRARSVVLIAFVVLDLIVFAVTTVVDVGSSAPSSTVVSAAGSGGSATGSGRSAADEMAHRSAMGAVRPLGTLRLDGRFAVYDPTLRYPGQLTRLGVPDTNVLSGTYSAQGYGSIVDGPYARATGTHGVSGTGQDVFAPQAAADGVFDSLDTTTILVPASYLVSAAGAATSAGTSDDRTAVRGRPAVWELGTPRAVTAVTVPTARQTVQPVTAPSSAGPVVPQDVRVGLMRSNGQVEWSSRLSLALQNATDAADVAPLPGTATEWTAAWPAPVQAVAVVVATADRTALDAPLVTTAGGTRLRPSGTLDAALSPPHWTYAGRDGAFAIYHNHRARRPLTLQALAGGTLAGATIERTGGPALDPLSARVSSPHGVSVVRAMAAIPGWSATWTPTGTGGHRTVHLAVRREGVAQIVRVPAGRGTLTWHYRAPDLVLGLTISGASVVVLALLVGAALLRAADHRRSWGAATTAVGR